MTASSHTLLGLLCLALHLQKAAATCYFADGSASTDTPCSDDDESACCGDGWTCYGTSTQYYLCQKVDDTDTLYARGSCTDKSWSSTSCPSVCDNDDNGVGKCSGSDTEFYCSNSDYNCTTGDNIIEFASKPSALTTISVVASTSSAAASSSTSSSISSFTSSSATTASSSTLTASTKATTTTSPAVTVTSTPYPSNSDDDSDSSSNKTAIGVGVGVGVGALVIIAALAFWFIRQRNHKRDDATAAASAAGFHFPAGSGSGSPPNMEKAPTGYAPTPNLSSPVGTLGTHMPPSSTSPYPPSELYDSPAPAYKVSQPHIGEMPDTQPTSRYEMA